MPKIQSIFPILCLLAYLGAVTRVFAAPAYVSDIWGRDTNNGSSWQASLKTIKKAISICQAGDSVVIAAGTYYEWNLLLPDNVNLYGGFAGDEDLATFDLKDRDFKANETRIDASGHDHCIVIAHAGTPTPTQWIIDGLTLTGGYADSSESWGVNLDGVSQDDVNGSNIGSDFGNRGGGIYAYCQPVIGETFGGKFPAGSIPPYLIVRNCLITNNRAKTLGGGFLLNRMGGTIEDCTVTLNSSGDGGGGALPESNDQGLCTMRNVLFADNTTDGNWTGGGGAFMWKNRGTTTNCRFINNTSTKAWGGGIALDAASKQVFTNCVFAGNKAPKGAAIESGFFDDYIANDAMYGDSTATLINCTIADNTATAGGSAYWAQQSARLTAINTIFHGNSTAAGYMIDPPAPASFNYCLIGVNSNPSGLFKSNVTSSNQRSGDPLFLAPGSGGKSGDYHLRGNSPAIGAALQNIAPGVDISGKPRNVPYDIGAYEFIPTPPTRAMLEWAFY